VIEMTSDFAVDFLSELYDADNNRIDAATLTWLEVDVSSGAVRDITTELLLNDMRWEATTVGNWTIEAYSISGTGFNISDSITIKVLHGVAVTVVAEASLTNPTAGDRVDIRVTGYDADDNRFPQNVEWTENDGQVATMNVDTRTDGAYFYDAEVAGLHTLAYAAGGANSVLEITVDAQKIVARLEVNLSTDTVDQLGSLDVGIRAFDAFENEIDVPGSIQVDATGRATVTMIASNDWTIKTLDDGPQTITISVGAVRVNEEITVVGNLNGFFEAGGTLYYVGAGLLALVAVVLLALGVMFLRSGGADDWDDDDEDEDDDAPSGPTGPAPGPTGPAPGPTGPAPGPTGPAPGPTGPAPGPSGPPAEEVASEAAAVKEDEAETSVDEDGTEWYEDETGTWWYRVAGEEEWHEYHDE